MTNSNTESWHDYLHRLITDTAIVGTVGWVGTVVGIVSLAVTIAGFAIAIAQIKRVKRSSEAANAAIEETTQILKFREQSSKLAIAISSLKYGVLYLGHENAIGSMAYLENGITALIEARQLSKFEADQDRMTVYLSTIRRITEEVHGGKVASLTQLKTKNYSGDLRKVIGEMEEISARLRYDFSSPSTSQ